MWLSAALAASLSLLLFAADEIKIDAPDEPLRARIIAFSVWGILRGFETFSQLVYTPEESQGTVSPVTIFTHSSETAFYESFGIT